MLVKTLLWLSCAAMQREPSELQRCDPREGLSSHPQSGPLGSDTERYLGRAFHADVTLQVQRNRWMDGWKDSHRN